MPFHYGAMVPPGVGDACTDTEVRPAQAKGCQPAQKASWQLVPMVDLGCIDSLAQGQQAVNGGRCAAPALFLTPLIPRVLQGPSAGLSASCAGHVTQTQWHECQGG